MYACILALDIQHAKRTPLIALSAVACQVIGYRIFAHYFDERHDLRANNLKHKTCNFLHKFCLKYFSF
jgi:hypothetical protein